MTLGKFHTVPKAQFLTSKMGLIIVPCFWITLRIKKMKRVKSLLALGIPGACHSVSFVFMLINQIIRIPVSC